MIKRLKSGNDKPRHEPLNIMDKITSVRKAYKLRIESVDEIAKMTNFNIEDVISILEGTTYDVHTNLLQQQSENNNKEEKEKSKK